MQVLIHKNDGHMLTNPTSNLSALGGGWIKTDAADIEVEEPYDIETAGVKLKVLETPGHTPGGISLYEEKAGVVFTGDALFADSVGRTDFPKGDMGQLVAGIKAKLLTLADETVVYPGHGPATTIGQERKYNQYLQG
jgi:glyoxylase-like metal-dependent hydrolase (beta-lactamase superfamily II)